MSRRPAGKGGKLVTLYAMGLDYDNVHIPHADISSSRETFIDEFYRVTGRKDIVFGDTVWLSTWRYWLFIIVSAAFSDCHDRPNIRMVDQFSVGRVFIVGGEPISTEECGLT